MVADVDGNGRLALRFGDDSRILFRNAHGVNRDSGKVLRFEHGSVISKIAAHGVAEDVNSLRIDRK